MSSGLEQRAGIGLAVRVTLANALLLSVAGVALWLIALQAVRSSLHNDWELKREQFHSAWTSGGDNESLRRMVSEEHVMVSLPPAAQNRLEEHFTAVLPQLLLAMIAASLMIGGWLAYRHMLPLRMLAARADALANGRTTSGRLLPSNTYRGDLAELAGLFDGLLDRNEDLVRTMHESLDHIGHDLRTPMARLRAQAELSLESGEPNAMKEALGTCIEESEQALALLATLVDLSHAQSGSLALHRQPTNVGEMLENVRDLYEFVAEEHRIHLRVEAPSELVTSLDPTRVRQAIANCVDNAIKYGASDDEVVLRANMLAHGGVRVEIEDHGRGIPPADLPLIWKRLFRGDRARSSEGLGLGLSVVRAIVEAHGGSCEATSESGRTVIALEFSASVTPPARNADEGRRPSADMR